MTDTTDEQLFKNDILASAGFRKDISDKGNWPVSQ